jgi:cell division protein FtsQ
MSARDAPEAPRHATASTVSASSAQRFADRARSRRRRPWGSARIRPWRVALIGALVLVAAGTGGWLVLDSPVLGVSEVSVSGTRTLSPAVVRQVASIAPGTPLARVHTAAVAARISTLPRVASVTVVRRWPRSIALVVRERVPLAAVPAAGGGYSLVDREAVAFQHVAEAPGAMPVLQLGGAAGALPGPVLTTAVDVLASLPEALRSQVRTVTATTPDDVQLALRHGRTVVWGGAGRSQLKAAVLAALMKVHAKTYDVSAPDVPTTR